MQRTPFARVLSFLSMLVAVFLAMMLIPRVAFAGGSVLGSPVLGDLFREYVAPIVALVVGGALAKAGQTIAGWFKSKTGINLQGFFDRIVEQAVDYVEQLSTKATKAGNPMSNAEMLIVAKAKARAKLLEAKLPAWFIKSVVDPVKDQIGDAIEAEIAKRKRQTKTKVRELRDMLDVRIVGSSDK